MELLLHLSMKRCTRGPECINPLMKNSGGYLSLSNFHKNKNTKDGLQNQCKPCLLLSQKQSRQKNPQGYIDKIVRFWKSEKGKQASKRAFDKIRHTNIKKAHSAVSHAVRSGKLPRVSTGKIDCSFCKEKAKHYHHHKGYSFKYYLDVVPVCVPCHRRLDARK